MSCGKHPCLCKSTAEEKLIEIPFMGDASFTNQTTPEQVATFIDPDDRIPVLLAMSLYTGTPRNNLFPWELIPSSVTPRTACWIFENTIICATRGTSPSSPGGDKDINDDKVKHFTLHTTNFHITNLSTYRGGGVSVLLIHAKLIHA